MRNRPGEGWLRDRYDPMDLFALLPKLSLAMDPELAQIDRLLEDELLFQRLKTDLLQRGILNEQEFVKANESLRSQKGALEARREELSQWVEEQRNKVSVAERIPEAIRSFLEDFQGMEARLQKARRQTILKAAHVYRDGRIELEFRG